MTPLITKKATYQKKSATSKDGTTIGFRQLGHGPGVVILHGGALASQHYMKLGTALAEKFTVYIPDRRGRGMSGPYGPHYSIEREDEDLDAVVTDTVRSTSSERRTVACLSVVLSVRPRALGPKRGRQSSPERQ
jgi:alpha-beta hydrolase superfamily lysophospholipase